jgi:Leucine-rich repeat (LRR) protein
MSGSTPETCWLLEAMRTLPSEAWAHSWPAQRTIMMRKTSKQMRDTVDKMTLPIFVVSRFHKLFYNDSKPSPTEHIGLAFSQLRVISSVCLITKIELVDCGLNSENMHLLARIISDSPDLTYLDIGFNDIQAGINEIFDPLAKCSRLTTLILTGNFIGDVGLKGLEDVVAHLSELQYLDLSRNNITSEGLESFAPSLIFTPRLRFLHLSNNKTCNGVSTLSSVMHLCSDLIHIDLSHTNFGTFGYMLMYMNMPRLRRVTLVLIGNKSLDEVTIWSDLNNYDIVM